MARAMAAPVGPGRRLHGIVLATMVAMLAACAVNTSREVAPPPPPEPTLKEFQATAYSVEGKTATGGHTHEGICAADPNVLPLGSRIRVHEAGEYSGEYVVTDTGRKIKGQKIDIYLANDAEAKRFGRKQVRVELLSSAK